MPKRIVGLCGLAGSGKSAAAHYLTKWHGYRRLRFADPLKRMLKALGLNDAQLDGDEKEFHTHLLCGQSPRRAMQTLGTEWGRNCIHSELWVRLWQQSLPFGERVVTDDVRFVNEVKMIREQGGWLIRVDRPGIVRGDHVSEHATFDADAVIVNDGTLPELYDKVVMAING